MLPVGNMDTWGGICYNFFCKRSNRHGSIPRHHSGMVFVRKGSFPGRPSAGEALRPSDSTARGGYDAGNQVSQLRESFSGG